MERKSLTYFKALICAFGLALAGSPPGTVFAKENDTKQEASAGSSGSVYRAEDAKDMAEHVSAVGNGTSDRLIVSETADLSDFLDKGTAVYYDGTYIISFDNSGDQKAAYQTLREEFGEDAVFHDARLSVCGNEAEDKSSKEQEMDQTDDEVVQEDEKAVPEEASESDGVPLVAMIDTGCNDENVSQSLNLTSEDPDDLNGHGTQMYQYMLDAAGETDFRLLSVKAFGEDGTASVSDIITAIKYAEEEGADAVCLSASARDSDDLSVLKTEIMNAIAYGIEVIVPAGNDSGDAMDYVPSDIDGVVVIGAASEDGAPLPSSNTGDCVSCYVTADSTSEAAAKYTGYLIAGKLDSEDIHYQDGDDTAYRNGIATYATTAGSSSGIYAVYCSANTTLYILQDATTNRAIGSSITFRDASRVTRQGIITQNDFITCKGTSASSYCLAKDKTTTEAITAVVNLLGTSQKVQPVSTAYWFAGFANARTIDVSWIDTSRVTDMTGMFFNCSSVTSLNVASFDTSNVTSMSQTFAKCSSLQTFEAPKWNTSKVATMYGMFGMCTALKSVNIAAWDTSNVTRMDSMFLQCENLISLDLSKWNTSKVTTFLTAFFSCSKLNRLDISGWDTSAAKTGLRQAFGGCKLFQISLGPKTVLPSDCGLSAPTSSSHVTYTGNWVKRGSTETVSTSELISKSQSSAAGTWVAEGASVAHAVYCSGNKTFYLVRLNGVYTIGSSVSFKDKSGTTRTGVVTQNDLESTNGASSTAYDGISTGTTSSSSYQSRYLVGTMPVANVTAIVCTDPVYPITTQCWFFGCTNVTSIDLSGMDTKNTTNMEDMLSSCRSLQSLTLGPNTVLKSTCGLYTPSGGNLSGKWKLEGSQSQSPLTSSELISKSSFGAAGTWTAEELVSCAAYCADNTTLYLTKVTNTYQVGDSVTITDKGGTERNCKITDVNLENTSFSYSISMANAYKGQITSVICLDAITPKSTNYWFSGLSNTTSMDLALLNTGDTSTMNRMFYNCSSLTALDLSNFDTSNVTDMNCMFYRCSSLTDLDLSNFDTGNVTNMYSMFYNCSSLTALNVSSFNTSNVTNMGGMFQSCMALTTLNVSHFDTSNVTSMSYMFSWCRYLTELDLSGFDTNKVTSMNNMLSSCKNLLSVTLGANTVLLSDCGLTDPSDTSKYTGKWTLTSPDNHSGQLSSSELIAKTQGTGGAPGRWTAEKLIIAYAAYCADNTTLYLIKTSDTYQVGDSVTITDKGGTARNCEITDVDLESRSPYSTTSLAKTYKSQIISVICLNTITPKSTGYWFIEFSNVTSMDLALLNTGNVTGMSSMFSGCSKLTTLDVSNFDTGNVTDMSSMFYNCSGLTAIDVSNFDTGNVTDMNFMFSDCSGLTTIDVSNFDTGNVTNMSHIFYNCSGLTTIDVSGFDTGNVTGMSSMFSGCSKLTTLDVSNFDTGNVTSMSYMFDGCSGLTTIDVSNFDTGNVTDMSSMFYNCSGLTAIDVSNFDTGNVTDMDYMFSYCSKLTSIKLGAKTVLSSNCRLPTPSDTSRFTGKWTLSDPYNHSGQLSSSELIAKTQKTKVIQEAGIPTATKYAHTSNLDDTGSGNNGYGNNVSDFQTVSIPGASKLYIQVTYQTESASWDYLRIYQGTVTTSQSDNGIAGKLGGTAKTTKTVEVDGDTATFHFESDSSSDNYYGYYAVVTDTPAEDIVGPTGEAAGLWVAERILLNAKLQLTQYDAGTNKLGSAEYALYKEDGTPVNFTAAGTNKIVINQNGQSDVLDSTLFVAGKYYLLQTKAPDGYAAAQQINFEIKDSDAGQTVQIEAHNNKLVALPSTGGTGRAEIYLNAALLFVAVGMMMLVKKKISA